MDTPELGLLEHRLLFVTGKGGVGKTSVSAALAMLGASRGKRVLVVQVDGEGGLPEVLESGPIAYDPVEVSPNLWAMSVDTEEALREYIRRQLRLPIITRLGPLARSFDFVANAAPGVKELLVIGKIMWEIREKSYDLVVVDSSASGHVVSQLSAPNAVNELVQVGRIREQTQWMIDLLADPVVTGAVIVTTPEEMPVTEAIELLGRLESETDVNVAAIVVNKVLPELFGRGEQQVFDALNSVEGRRAFAQVVGDDPAALLDGADLASRLRRSRGKHLERLRSEIPGDRPMIFLPQLFSASHGIRSTRELAEAFDDEIGEA
jgi:anion-transporting  ArsA/GET3 family ATPase